MKYNEAEVNEYGETNELESRAHQQIALKQGMRSRLLLRVRRHFDFAGKHFFPTLRLKIVEVVDVAHAIQQIKQVRKGGLSDKESKSTEANLWDQIKVSAFVILFTAAYSVSIVAIVLRVQLHILARNAALYNDDDGTNSSPSEAELKYLIDSTFRYIFSDGLQKLTEALRTKVESALVDWTVREKTSVQFVEFVDIVSYIRKIIEKDMKAFVTMTISVPSSPPPYSSSGNKTGATPIKLSNSVEELFSQSADIFESQIFRAVLLEAFDCSFRLLIDDLKNQVK